MLACLSFIIIVGRCDNIGFPCLFICSCMMRKKGQDYDPLTMVCLNKSKLKVTTTQMLTQMCLIFYQLVGDFFLSCKKLYMILVINFTFTLEYLFVSVIFIHFRPYLLNLFLVSIGRFVLALGQVNFDCIYCLFACFTALLPIFIFFVYTIFNVSFIDSLLHIVDCIWYLFILI